MRVICLCAGRLRLSACVVLVVFPGFAGSVPGFPGFRWRHAVQGTVTLAGNRWFFRARGVLTFMHRAYHKWHSARLGRPMELLVFGHAGLPVLAFPTSEGRFYQIEDCGLIATLAPRIEAGELQLFCVDSVDSESWYNRRVAPRLRIRRHMQYEQYLLEEVLPFLRQLNADPRLCAMGCSFGGYHAANLAFRHPDLFTAVVSLSGAFDLSVFLDGYYDQDCYFHLPMHYLPNLSDPWYLDRFRRSRYVLATGWDDQCLEQNRQLNRILDKIQIPHQLHIWDARQCHDWPVWKQMAQSYL